jgi:hypothetical protein
MDSKLRQGGLRPGGDYLQLISLAIANSQQHLQSFAHQNLLIFIWHVCDSSESALNAPKAEYSAGYR